jgi:hypothetical protein
VRNRGGNRVEEYGVTLVNQRSKVAIIFRGHADPGFFVRAVGLSPAGSRLEVLPNNLPPQGARYICIVVVRDYLRMTRAYAEKQSLWHYSQLEPEILQDVRDERATVVFDLSNEGPAFSLSIFSELSAWIETNHLPPGRCVWLAQNRAVASGTELGTSRNLVRFEYYDYFVKIVAWMFSPSSRENILGTDPEAAIKGLFDKERKDKLLLCLNATPRMSRIVTVAALHHHQLIAPSIVSFPGFRYVKQGAALPEVLDFLQRNPQLGYLRPSVEAVAKMPPLRADEFEQQGNALALRIDPSAYTRTFFSLVTESDFSGSGIERVTEKLSKAYAMGHPTIPVGNARSIKFMTDLGFQDWSTVFDRRSESVDDPGERFELVIQEVLRQTQEITRSPQDWLRSTTEIGVHNVRHAVSGRFLSEFVRKIDNPVIERLAASVGHS